MKIEDLAPALRRLADVVDKVVGEGVSGKLPISLGGLPEEPALGAAMMVCYLRDLFTVAKREEYRREDVLVILENIANDGDIFPAGMVRILWDVEEDHK